VNVVGTGNLCAAAAAAGVRRFVYVSTRAIDPAGGGYSASKAAAEDVVRRSGLEWVIVRLPEVYGADGKEGIDDLIRRGLAGRRIPIVGDGSVVLRPIHVDDAVAALVAALRTPRTEETFTLGGDPITLQEVARASAAAGGGRSRIVGLPPWAIGLACRAARLLPLPVYPDQLKRLTAPKPDPSPQAATELGFRPRPFSIRADAVESSVAVDR
jgi:NADH dehydrogenase